jgi:N4-gp56 family major capsid protein
MAGIATVASTTEYGDVSRAGAAFVVATALACIEPILVLQKFGQVRPMPKNKGLKIHFRRPVPFAVATTPLSEGITPVPKQMAYERVEATLNEYGDLVEITDKVSDLSEDPVLQEAAEQLGDQAAETTEVLLWGILKAGTSVFYDTTGHSTRITVNSPITYGRQSAVTRFLKKQRAKKITSILSGSVKVGTKPIEAAYIAFAHTDLEYDIRALPNFTAVAAYGSMQPASEQELGVCGDVRYILSPLLTPFSNAGASATPTMVSTGDTNVADVYPVVYISKDAYGLVPLAGKESIHPYVLAPDKPSKSDPLAQRGYVAWKTWWTALILNELWMARLEVACTKI